MPDVRLGQISANVDVDNNEQEIQNAQTAVNADVDNQAQEIQLAQALAQVDARVPALVDSRDWIHFYLYDRYGHPLTILDNVVAAQFRLELSEAGAGEIQLLADEKIALIQPWHVIRARYRGIDVFSFYVETIERSPVGSERNVRVSGRGLLSCLERGIVYNPDGDSLVYNNVALGAILYDLVQRFHERGGSDIVPTFSPTRDSDNKSWSLYGSFEFRNGTSLLSAAQQLAAYGLEIRVDADHTFNVYEALGEDRSLSVLFEEGKNIIALTRREDATTQANVVFARGQDRSVVKVENLAYRVRDGVREVFLDVGHALNSAQAQIAAQRYLQAFAEPQQSLEIEISTHDYIPFVSYHLGDWVCVRTQYWSGAYRILALDCIVEEGSLPRLRLTCNSVLRERQLRLERAYRLYEHNLAGVHASGLTSHDPREIAYRNDMGPVSALADVIITSPRATEEVLVWQSGDNMWHNRDAATLGGGISRDEADARYINVDGDVMTGALAIRLAASGASLTTRQNSDTNDKLVITTEGALRWSDGTTTYDTELSRVAAGKLRIVDDVDVQDVTASSVSTTALTATNGTVTQIDGNQLSYARAGINAVVLSDYSLNVGAGTSGAIRLPDGSTGRCAWSDVALYRYSTGTLAITGRLYVFDSLSVAAVPNTSYRLVLGSGTQAALQLAGTNGTAADGIRFGVDTNLYRAGSGVLRTDHKMIVMSGLGIGASNPATNVESEQTQTITAATADGYAAALTFDPRYSATSAQNVQRHNYIDILNVTTTNVTVADACVMRFNAAAGVHKAVDSGTTKATPSAVNAWIKININGTIYYIPAYTSKTS